MTNPTSQNPNDPNRQQDAGERINQTLEQTGKKISEQLDVAGEKVQHFMEEKRVNEQLEVAGGQLVERVKSLIEEGNVRRLILRNTEGRVLLEIPLTAGVAVGGAVLWMNPLLAGLGAIAALIARVNIEIVREEPEATQKDIKDTANKVKQEVKSAAEDVKKSVSGGTSGSSSGGMGGSSSR